MVNMGQNGCREVLLDIILTQVTTDGTVGQKNSNRVRSNLQNWLKESMKGIKEREERRIMIKDFGLSSWANKGAYSL